VVLTVFRLAPAWRQAGAKRGRRELDAISDDINRKEGQLKLWKELTSKPTLCAKPCQANKTQGGTSQEMP
jgi:hypothetical protein